MSAEGVVVPEFSLSPAVLPGILALSWAVVTSALVYWGASIHRAERRRDEKAGLDGGGARPRRTARPASEPAVDPLDVFDRRLARHEADKARLERLKIALAAMIVIGLALMLNTSSDLDNQDILGIEVPLRLLRVLLPLGFVFAWGRFGFTLAQLIKDRMALRATLDGMNDRDEDAAHSLRSLLADDALLDAYFAVYAPEAGSAERPASQGRGLLFLLAYIAFFAALHAVALATGWLALSQARDLPWLVLTWSVMIFVVFFFSLTHHQFARVHGTRRMHVAIVAGAVALALGLPTLAR